MIIGVAVRFKDGFELRLPAPYRHYHCFADALHLHGIPHTDSQSADDQGFYTHTGQYLNRKDAMAHVREVGQALLPDARDGHVNASEYLMSEDVWRDG